MLAIQPDQPRALYGLAIASLLQGNATRARELFQQVVAGASGASGAPAHSDPVALAWSHVYLARILEDEGQVDRAKAEYQAAITVQGAPPQAQQAAQKGLGALDLRKTKERPEMGRFLLDTMNS